MRALRFIGAVVALVVLLPFAVAVWTPSSQLPWQGTLLVMVYAGLRLSGLYALGEPRLYSVSTWTFTYVFLGLAPTMQMRLRVDPDTTPFLIPWTQERAVGIVLIGLVSLEAGLLLRDRVHRQKPTGMSRPPRVLTRSSVAFFSIFAFVVCALIVARTGPAAYLGSRDGLTLARNIAFPNTTVSAFATGLTVALPLVAFHALVLLRREEGRQGRPGPFLLTTVAMGALLLFTTNPISGARILFGTVLLSLAVLAGATRTPRRTSAFILAMLVGLILLFPAADAFRRSDVSADTVGTIQVDPTQLASSGDYDAFAQIANTAYFVELNGTTNGRQALGAMLFFVPRAAWPNKPRDSGVIVGEFRGYGFTNLSAPFWAEGYINGGYVGVVIGMGGLGWFVRRGDAAFAASQAAPRPAAITGAILPFYMLIVLRGSLLQAVAILALLVISAAVVSRRAISS